MAYLSVPSPGKWSFGPFGKNICRRFFGPTFFEKMDLRRVLWLKCQVKKVSYIDPLVMMFSPKSKFFHWKFPSTFQFFGKAIFSVFYNTENQFSRKLRFSDLFLSPVPPVLPLILFFSQKKDDFWKNTTPEKGHV